MPRLRTENVRVRAEGNFYLPHAKREPTEAQRENGRRIAALEAERRRSSPYCRNGHLRTPENTYFRPDGKRVCKSCRKAHQLRYIAKQNET